MGKVPFLDRGFIFNTKKPSAFSRVSEKQQFWPLSLKTLIQTPVSRHICTQTGVSTAAVVPRVDRRGLTRSTAFVDRCICVWGDGFSLGLPPDTNSAGTDFWRLVNPLAVVLCHRSYTPARAIGGALWRGRKKPYLIIIIPGQRAGSSSVPSVWRWSKKSRRFNQASATQRTAVPVFSLCA